MYTRLKVACVHVYACHQTHRSHIVQSLPLGTAGMPRSVSLQSLKVKGGDDCGIIVPSSPVSPPIAAVHGTFAAAPTGGNTPLAITASATTGDHSSKGGEPVHFYLDTVDNLLEVVSNDGTFAPWTPDCDPPPMEALPPFDNLVTKLEMACDRAKRLRSHTHQRARNGRGPPIGRMLTMETLAKILLMDGIETTPLLPTRLLAVGAAVFSAPVALLHFQLPLLTTVTITLPVCSRATRAQPLSLHTPVRPSALRCKRSNLCQCAAADEARMLSDGGYDDARLRVPEGGRLPAVRAVSPSPAPGASRVRLCARTD